MSLAEDIRGYVATVHAPVLPVPSPELPKWDGQLGVVRVCPRAIANQWKEADDDNPNDERAKFVVLVASDLEGNRIFTEADILWLSTCAVLTPLVERLYSAGLHHNGLTAENRQAWKKNCPPTVGTGSPSSSSAPCRPSEPATAAT